MKYITLLFITIATLSARAQYVDLLQSDTSFHWLSAHDNTSLSGTTHSESSEYFTGRTVTVNGQQYKETYNGLQHRHFREDAQHNIYGLDPADTVETLLFAFDAQVGDTIPFHGFIGDSSHLSHDYYYAIDSMDTVDVNGTQRRAIYVSTNIPSGQPGFFIPLIWIEGIGEARYGLHSVFVSDLYNGFSFCGVYQQNAPIYTAGGNCYEILSVNDLSETAKVRLYPTPATEAVIIENNSTEKLAGYRLVDLTGQVVAAGMLANSQYSGITISHLVPGVYFALLNDDKGHVFKQRIVKQ